MNPTPDPPDGIRRLLAIVARLRGKDGCPWDREQTLASLKPNLIEECYEVVDAVDAGDASHHAEELGDLLLQIAMQAQIRAESGDFTFDDVANRIADKLIRRHPHVFGDVQVGNADDVLRNWDKIKAGEKAEGADSALGGVPRHLPALQKAQRVQARAARVGFDWERIADVIAKVEEETSETREAIAGGDAARIREELGDLLFAVVNLTRFCKVEAEEALQATVAKFMRRFGEVERRVREEGKSLRDCSLAVMDAHWEAVKRAERQ